MLQIYRERLTPGADAAYEPIEEETARLAASLGCPHPYLAAELRAGATEVWWFNGFESPADRQRVADRYAANASWMAALTRNSERKSPLTIDPIDAIAIYRPDLTSGVPWILGRGRFLAVALARATDPAPAGTVFDAPDGTRFVVTPAQTREEAEAASMPDAAERFVLAVRPSFSFPAHEWIAADPDFWRPKR
jgi:hypothetical protein